MEPAKELKNSRGTKPPRFESEVLEDEDLTSSNHLRAKRQQSDWGNIDEVAPTPNRFPLRTSDSDKLFDIFTKRDAYWTIFDSISSVLPIGDILALQRTCKATAPIYQELQKSQWNIDMRLKRFFKDPVRFRSKLGENNALVSGSFALQFFGT
jgi:hypothetical protein